MLYSIFLLRKWSSECLSVITNITGKFGDQIMSFGIKICIFTTIFLHLRCSIWPLLFFIEPVLINLRENYRVTTYPPPTSLCYLSIEVRLSSGCLRQPEQLSNSSLHFIKIASVLDFHIQNEYLASENKPGFITLRTFWMFTELSIRLQLVINTSCINE